MSETREIRESREIQEKRGESEGIWSELNSDFFRSMSGGENLCETPPAAQVQSSMPDVRQILHMIFMVDVSGSMRGQRIAMVNNALESIFSELRQRDDLHAVIKVSIMTFAEKAQWVTPNPIRLEDYVMMKLTTVPWITCYAPAFDELSRVLRRERFLDPSLGEYYAPLIPFVTDGEPTDFDEYPGALARLRRNGWFRKATKYAIATGVEAQSTDTLALLAEFTGVRENVRYADEGEALCDMIQFVAVRASEVQTSVASSSDSNAGIPSVFPKEDGLFSSLFET